MFWNIVLSSIIIDTNVKVLGNTSKLKWHRIVWMSSSKNTMIKSSRSSSSINSSNARNVNKRILNNIMSLISSGTRIFSKHNKKMLKLLVHLKIDIHKKLKLTARPWRKSFHFHSSLVQNCWTNKSNNNVLPNRKSKYKFWISETI